MKPPEQIRGPRRFETRESKRLARLDRHTRCGVRLGAALMIAALTAAWVALLLTYN